MKIAVVGGGISGLTAAFRLAGDGHDVVCLEPGRPGGLMRSERRDGFLCEAGPNALLDGAAEVRSLVADAGLAERVVPASVAARTRMIFLRGRLRAVPTGPPGLLFTDLLSFGAKLRLLREPFVPRRLDADDETVLAFAARRLGPTAARDIVAPAVLGIFAGDAGRLSVGSALPRLHALEAEHGSLWRGLQAARRTGGPGLGRLISFPDGLEELPRALAARLGDRLVAARVRALGLQAGGWVVDLEGRPPLVTDAVVLAAGPAATASLLAPLAPAAATALRGVPLAPIAVVALGFSSADIGVALEAYGFLVARGERPTLLGCQYESSVFPGRAPEGGVLLRALYGGVFDPRVVEEPDDALVERAVADLRVAAGLRASPSFSAVFRGPAVLPQYEVGHAERVRAVDEALAGLPGLRAIGYALRGVGMADCVRAATALAAELRPSS